MTSATSESTKRTATLWNLAVGVPVAVLLALLGIAFSIPLLSRFGQVVIPPFTGTGIQVAAGCGAVIAALVVLIVVGVRADRPRSRASIRVGGMVLSIMAGVGLIPAIASTLWLTSWSTVHTMVAVGSAPGCPEIMADVMSWDETSITFSVGHGILYTPVSSDPVEWDIRDGGPFAAGTYSVINEGGNPAIIIRSSGVNNQTIALRPYPQAAPICSGE